MPKLTLQQFFSGRKSPFAPAPTEASIAASNLSPIQAAFARANIPPEAAARPAAPAPVSNALPTPTSIAGLPSPASLPTTSTPIAPQPLPPQTMPPALGGQAAPPSMGPFGAGAQPGLTPNAPGPMAQAPFGGLPPWIMMLLQNPQFGMGGLGGGGLFGGGPRVGGGGAPGGGFGAVNPAQMISQLLGGAPGNPSGMAGAAAGAQGRVPGGSVPALSDMGNFGGLQSLLAQFQGSPFMGRFGSMSGAGNPFPFSPFLRGGGGFGSGNPFAGAGPNASLMAGSQLQQPQEMDMRRLLLERLMGGGGAPSGGGGLNVG